jgi:hypothetical protein
VTFHDGPEPFRSDALASGGTPPMVMSSSPLGALTAIISVSHTALNRRVPGLSVIDMKHSSGLFRT